MKVEQLYGFKRFITTLRMAFHPGMKRFSFRQKMAFNHVMKEIKLTRLGDKIYSNTFTPYFPSPAYTRYLEGIDAITSGKPLPVITNFAVTAKCPCRCWHCSFSHRSRSKELSLSELKELIVIIQDLGTSVIGITGGEPLLRKDLEKIISAIDKRSMPILFTTGYGLTPERVRSLKDAGLEIPVISLDHYSEAVHDAGRGRKGIFNQSIKAIEMFRNEGFYVAVSFVPDRKLVNNRDELYRTIEFFKDLGINDMRLTSPILSGKLTARESHRLTQENRQTLFELQKMCVRKKGYPGVFGYDFFERREYYGCTAGFGYLFVDSTGNISPCDFTMLTLGNARKEPLEDIWKRMSRQFSAPGCECYANVISSEVKRLKSKTWPLNEKDSQKIIRKCPSCDKNDLPVFFRQMGFGYAKNNPATSPKEN